MSYPRSRKNEININRSSVESSEYPAGHPDILDSTEYENDKLNKKVSSDDILVKHNYYQIKFLLGCKQEFVQLALTEMNEIGLNLP